MNSEKALLLRPEALDYLRRRLPDVLKSRQSPELRRILDAPNQASRRVVMERIAAERATP